jgi:hypothetical protein
VKVHDHYFDFNLHLEIKMVVVAIRTAGVQRRGVSDYNPLEDAALR